MKYECAIRCLKFLVYFDKIDTYRRSEMPISSTTRLRLLIGEANEWNNDLRAQVMALLTRARETTATLVRVAQFSGYPWLEQQRKSDLVTYLLDAASPSMLL